MVLVEHQKMGKVRTWLTLDYRFLCAASDNKYLALFSLKMEIDIKLNQHAVY